MYRLLTPFVLLLPALTGCGGSDGPSGPAQRVFTSLSLTAASTTIFSRAPGNTATLTARALDQNGQLMAGLGSATFTSDDTGIATVDAAGIVTAVASGDVSIRASLTANGATHTASLQMTVTDGDLEATVTAPAFIFTPQLVDLVQGGTVTWTFAGVSHNVVFVFQTEGAPADHDEPWAGGSRSRTFPARGTFRYVCTLHTGMFGDVVVR